MAASSRYGDLCVQAGRNRGSFDSVQIYGADVGAVRIKIGSRGVAAGCPGERTPDLFDPSEAASASAVYTSYSPRSGLKSSIVPSRTTGGRVLGAVPPLFRSMDHSLDA